MFRLKGQAEGATNIDNTLKLKRMLEELPSKIDQIKLYEVGINIADSPSASDIVLISGFESVESLNEYRVHPEHVKVLEFVRKVTDEARVVDYEV